MSELTRDIVCDETETCPTLGCEDCIFLKMNKKLLAEQEKVRKLVKALKFYSITENYGYSHAHDDHVEWISEDQCTRMGELARQTLKEVEGV